MLKPIESILFATDLSQNCQQAYEHAIGLSIRFKATLYLLYVIEAIPENVESRLKSLMGRHNWDDLMSNKVADVQKTLTGKIRSHGLLGQIQEFCRTVGVDDDVCEFQSREIIISSGDIAENILEHAKENECDLIILGTKKGMLAPNSVGSKCKAVLKHSPIPVTLVPAAAQ
ncbi:MAG: universal stress protein [Desulfopila sp.]